MFFPFHDDNPTTRPPIITVSVILLNAFVFISMQRMSEFDRNVYVIRNGFVPKRIEQLTNPNLQLQVPAVEQVGVRGPQGRVLVIRQPVVVPLPPDRNAILLTLITTMFLHGSWMHLLGNMWFLWLFGNNIEDRLGHLPYLLFYLLGGLAATACHWALHTQELTAVIGASGAIAAVLGAYAVKYPTARVHTLVVFIVFITVIDLPALVVLGIWFAMQLLSAVGTIGGELGGGVAWWAHVGGFAAGAALMPIACALFPGPGKVEDEPHSPDFFRV